MGWLDDAVAEITNLQNIARRKKVAEQWARTISADTAKRIGEIGRWYQWLPAGVITAMGQAGYDPLSEDTRRVVAEATRAQSVDPLDYMPVGARVNARSFTQPQLEQASRDVKFAASYLRDPYAELRHRLSKHGPEWVERLDRKILERNMSRDDLADLAEMKDNFLFLVLNDDGGWGPKWLRDNPLTDNVLEPLARHGFTGENPFARGVRGATRGVTSVFQYPQQYAQAQYRTFTQDVREHGWVEALSRLDLRRPGPRIMQQTDVGQIVVAAASGERIDTGSGFFVSPESGVAQARQEAEVRYGGTYENGQVRSLGRDFASLFFEPGSREFNIVSGVGDAAVALGADAVSFNYMSRSRHAARLFRSEEPVEAATKLARVREEAMGLIRGHRTTYDPHLVDAWLGSRVGRRTIERIAEETSISRLDRAFNRKVPVEILRELVDETDPAAITRILKDNLGLTIREAPDMGGRLLAVPGGSLIDDLGLKIKDAAPPRMRRLASMLPTREHVDLADARQSLTQLERALVNVNADRATIDNYMKRMADARSVTSRRQVWFDMWSDVNRRLMVEQGVDEKRARELTRLWHNNQSDVRHYFVDAEGVDMNVLGVMVDGQVQRIPTPHLSVELLDRWLPMPDARALRREFSDPVTKYLLQNKRGELRAPWAIANWAQDKWRPTVLIRGAYMMRIGLENQAKIAAAGFKGMANHPAAYISYLVGDSPRVKRMLEKWGVQGRGHVDIFAGLHREAEEFGAGMQRLVAGFNDEFRLSNYILYQRGQPGYLYAAADELATLAADPAAQMVARVAGGTPARQQFIDVADELAETRGLPRVIEAREVGDNLPAVVDDLPAQRVAGEVATETAEATRPRNPLLEAQERFWNEFRFLREEMADARPNAALDLRKRAGSDEYVVTMLRRVNIKTGMRDDGTPAHPKLLEVVRTARVDGEPLFRPGTPFLNPKAVEKLAKYEDFFPDQVRGPQIIRLRTGKASDEGVRHLNRFVEWSFAYLGTKPENYLARSPVWRQQYEAEIIALASRVSRDDLDQLMKWADQTRLSRADKRTLRQVVGKHAGDDPMPLEALHQIAKLNALETVRSLLFDLTQRSQFFDVFRLIFPFGDAFREMFTTWGPVLRQNPKLPLTVKRVLEGGRSEQVGSAFGLPEGRTFFYENEWGDEMFAYGASGPLLGLLGQPPIPLTGRLSGLSLATEVLPGVGPVAQLPVAATRIIPDQPEYDWVRELFFPFGEPDHPEHPLSWGAQFVPPWMRQMFRPWSPLGEDQRVFTNDMMTIAQWQVAQGNYEIVGPNSREEVTRLVEDAKSQAVAMQVIRGMAQNVLPAAPVYEWYIDGPDGRKLLMAQLITEFREMQEEDFETATERFLDLYGDNAFLLMQGKTITVSPGTPAPTQEAWDWMRRNRWAEEEYGLVYGFFAPQGGEFSAEAYRRQLELEQRKPMDLREFIERGNDMIAKSIYYRAREQALEAAYAAGRKSLDDRQLELLRELDAYLYDNYEGYKKRPSPRVDTDAVIHELKAAVNDKRFEDAAVTPAIRDFLDFRDQVRAKSKEWLGSENTYRSGTSEDARFLRDLLVMRAGEIREEHPEFTEVWERVFRAEIEEGLRSDDLGGGR